MIPATTIAAGIMHMTPLITIAVAKNTTAVAKKTTAVAKKTTDGATGATNPRRLSSHGWRISLEAYGVTPR